jgi:hypothetical protein
VRQKICLGIQRSDYMLHDEGDGSMLEPRQVEINTIASSFAGLSEKASLLHTFLLGRVPLQGMSPSNCPANAPIDGIASAIAKASKLYCSAEPPPTPKSEPRNVAVLFVVQPDEGNVFDQRHLEFRLFEKHSTPVLRASLQEIEAEATLDEGSRRLVLRGYEISVVYFRAGYAPTDYHGDTEWRARLRIERSAAVKCPTAAYQCVGAKKIQQVLCPLSPVPCPLSRFCKSLRHTDTNTQTCKFQTFATYPQSLKPPLTDFFPSFFARARDAKVCMLLRQVLAQPGVTERFVDAKTASRIRSSYAGLYPLGDGSQEAAAAKARGIAQPDKYVLKPQREGGGNNLYDAEMKEGLEKMSDSELQAYILMDIIQAPRAPSLFMRDGELVETEAIAELGTYSTSIANGDKLVHNEYVGHLLRSKMANSKETGVAAGFGVIDSPYLYD